MSAGRSHSHVVVSLTSAANADGLSALDGLRLLNYSDSAMLGSPQTISFTLPGRAARPSGINRPLRELLSVGDLVRCSGFNWTGESGSGSGKVYGLCDAIVTDVQAQEVLSDGGYQFVTLVSAQGMQHILQVDSVAWWMHYGTQIGWAKTRGELMPDDVSGRLDRTAYNYLTKVAMNHNAWSRDGVGLGERVGLSLTSLPGNAPVSRNLTVAEGSHWGILSEHADLPLHELFMRMTARPGGKVSKAATHKPAAISSTEGHTKDDGAAPCIVLRPAPFPYADKGGAGQLGEWDALPLHDFTEGRVTTGQHAFGRSISGVRNFFMVFPSVDLLDERLAFTLGIAVYNEQSINRYSYRPVKFRSRLILKDGDQAGFLELAKELTWRIAGQMNRMDEMASGSISVPFAPEVQPGDRARFRLIGTDGVGQGVFQGYVTGRTHTWSPDSGGSTTIMMERILPDATYRNPAWFVQGLKAVDVDLDGPRAE